MAEHLVGGGAASPTVQVGGSSGSHSMESGKNYFIRTVTFHYTGKLKSITDSDIVLENAAWVADSGRFATALSSGELAEVEPYPGNVIISRGSIVDMSEWTHELPAVQQ